MIHFKPENGFTGVSYFIGKKKFLREEDGE